MMKYSFLCICALLVVIPNEAQLIGTHSGSVGTGDVNFEQCRTACPVNTDDSKPVCGSDGRTYPNVESLACAARCGREVRVEYEGYCPNDRF
ncbi:turripeptide Gsg9.2-like [Coccinella septempunctata]|uniref:turripeptide Gsg9.2-like n=1 Tax=Coccinella septempunctata TaxID=41139 RepID=UPI001D082D7F|nr:turripeptide Gsg9.2-like [Coccinella septempunctata]